MKLTIGEKAYALKHVFDDDWFEYIQLWRISNQQLNNSHNQTTTMHLELTTGTSHTHGGLIAHDLGSDHRGCFTLSRVNLPGHDTAAWFIFREAELAKSATRTRTEEANIVGNLH
jgi:hypothetical protein